MHLKLKVDTVSCYIFGTFNRLWTGAWAAESSYFGRHWLAKKAREKMPTLPVRLPEIVVIGGTVSLFAPFQFPSVYKKSKFCPIILIHKNVP